MKLQHSIIDYGQYKGFMYEKIPDDYLEYLWESDENYFAYEEIKRRRVLPITERLILFGKYKESLWINLDEGYLKWITLNFDETKIYKTLALEALEYKKLKKRIEMIKTNIEHLNNKLQLFIEKYGYKELNLYSMSDDIYPWSVGVHAGNIKIEYLYSSPEIKVEIKNLHKYLPEEFWDEKNFEQLFKLREEIFDYYEEHGFSKLTEFLFSSTDERILSLKNDIKNINSYMGKLCFFNFWVVISDEFFDDKMRTITEWKETFKLYENLVNTSLCEIFETAHLYLIINVGRKAMDLQNTYKKLSIEEKIEFKKSWDCFPDEFWEKKFNKDGDNISMYRLEPPILE